VLATATAFSAPLSAPQFTLHSGQYRPWVSPARFNVLACGRRWGKSEFGVMRRCARARDLHLKGVSGVSWVVGPTYKVLRPIWRKFMRLAPKPWVTNVYGTERMPDSVEFGRIKVEFKSAEIPENLVAEGLVDVWVDECGIIKEHVWSESIRPALMDFRAPGDFTGTPKGRNWFHRMYLRGQDPANRTTIASFSGPSWQNPFIPPEESEELRLEMSDRVYRQEILAEFLDDEGAVFRKVRSYVWKPTMPKPGVVVAWGIDVAKHQDFTVIIGLDANGMVAFFDRFNEVSWPLQKERIRKTCRGGAPVVIDSTGVGEPIFEDLFNAGLNVRGYVFSAQSKAPLIEGLTIALEDSKITLPDEPVLINELEAFEYETSPTGYVRYSAPEGLHDDCVIALALAWFSKTHYRSTGILI
jgi:hypothetical protein